MKEHIAQGWKNEALRARDEASRLREQVKLLVQDGREADAELSLQRKRAEMAEEQFARVVAEYNDHLNERRKAVEENARLHEINRIIDRNWHDQETELQEFRGIAEKQADELARLREIERAAEGVLSLYAFNDHGTDSVQPEWNELRRLVHDKEIT